MKSPVEPDNEQNEDNEDEDEDWGDDWDDPGDVDDYADLIKRKSSRNKSQVVIQDPSKFKNGFCAMTADDLKAGVDEKIEELMEIFGD